jgi:hypothetical protein
MSSGWISRAQISGGRMSSGWISNGSCLRRVAVTGYLECGPGCWPAKILEDSGSAEDLVHDRPPDFPLNPDLPRKIVLRREKASREETLRGETPRGEAPHEASAREDTPREETRAAARGGSRITLLARPGCHLCDDAREVIERVATDLGVGWEERDITVSPDDMREYWDKIPVTFVDGVQIDFWRVSEARLRAALA